MSLSSYFTPSVDASTTQDFVPDINWDQEQVPKVKSTETDSRYRKAGIDRMAYLSTDRVPWFGFGEIIQNASSAKEAMEKGGMDWTLNSVPLYGEINGQRKNVEGFHGLQRSDTGEIVHVSRETKETFQNWEGFEFMDRLVSTGQIQYRTVGTLKNGLQTWISATFGDPFDVVPGDMVENYLMLANSHDGSLRLNGLHTPTRVVCQNTFRHALSSTDGVKIKHTKHMRTRLDRAAEILGYGLKASEVFKDFAKHAVSKQINGDKLKGFLDCILPLTEDLAQKGKTQRNNTRDKIVDLFETGVGNNISGVRGTAWAAFNAVTEYSLYHRSTNQENAFSRVLLGVGPQQNDLNQLAYQYVSQLAA